MHRLSPSNRETWGNCPGSPNKCKKYKRGPQGKSAIDGDQTHYLLNKQLLDGKPPIVGMEYDPPKLPRFRLKDDRMERLKFATDYIYGRVIELDEQFGSETTLETEQKIYSKDWSGREDLNSKLDVTLVNGSFAEIMDLKDGMIVKKAENNPQLVIYAITKIYDLMMKGIFISHLRLTIIQPKARFEGLDGIDSWNVTSTEMLDKVKEVIAEVKATEDPDAPCIAGETQCRYCQASGNCEEQQQFIFKQSDINFADTTNLPEVIVNKEEENDISNERLKEIILVGPLIKGMLKKLEEEALRRFQLGNPVDGLKVIRGRGSKSWKVSPEEVAKKLNRMGVPKAVPWKQTIVTPNQAKALIWVKKKAGEEVEAKLSPRQVKTLDEEYIQVSQGSPKVVSKEANGVEIEYANENLFKPVEGAENQEIEIPLPDFLK